MAIVCAGLSHWYFDDDLTIKNTILLRIQRGERGISGPIFFLGKGVGIQGGRYPGGVVSSEVGTYTPPPEQVQLASGRYASYQNAFLLKYIYVSSLKMVVCFCIRVKFIALEITWVSFKFNVQLLQIKLNRKYKNSFPRTGIQDSDCEN